MTCRINATNCLWSFKFVFSCYFFIFFLFIIFIRLRLIVICFFVILIIFFVFYFFLFLIILLALFCSSAESAEQAPRTSATINPARIKNIFLMYSSYFLILIIYFTNTIETHFKRVMCYRLF